MSKSYFINSALNLANMYLLRLQPDNTCKLPHVWQQEFEALSAAVAPLGLPHVVFKIFSTSDCDGLIRAIPAALATNTKIWAKLWTGHRGRYQQEREALRHVLHAFPNAPSWLAGVSVGSEHLWRGEMSAPEIRDQICDIKQLVQVEFGYTGIPVGCADNDIGFEPPFNHQVMFAADHVNLNVYPFWDKVHINDALAEMQHTYAKFRDILRDDPDKIIALGEHGWPTIGSHGAAIGDVASAEKYWKTVGCWLHREGIPWSWFEAIDEPNKPNMNGASGPEQNWGLMRIGLERKFEMVC